MRTRRSCARCMVANRTGISWTDHTINPGLYGCDEISEACQNCYAAVMARRLEYIETALRRRR